LILDSRVEQPFNKKKALLIFIVPKAYPRKAHKLIVVEQNSAKRMELPRRVAYQVLET
jgi:hypothetical protein